MGEENNKNKDGKTSSNNEHPIVLSVVSKFGILIGRIAFILESKGDGKEKELGKLLHQLGYDVKDDSFDKIEKAFTSIIKVAKKIEEGVGGLVDFPWQEAVDDIKELKLNSEAKKEGKDLFTVGKDLFAAIKEAKKAVEVLIDDKTFEELGNFLEKSDFTKNFPRRFADHLLISILRKAEDGSLFDDKFIKDLKLSKAEKKQLKKDIKNSKFLKSLRIILATLDIFEIFDTEEVEVIYQDSEEENNAKKDKKAKEDKKNKEEDNDESKEIKITTEINVVKWARFEDLFTFNWSYLEEIYPMEMSTAKLLFKRLSKLINAIGKDEILDLLHVNDILEWIKSFFTGDDKDNDEARKDIQTIQTEYKRLGENAKVKKFETIDIETLKEHTSLPKDKTDIDCGLKELKKDDPEFLGVIENYLLTPTIRVLKREGVLEDIKDIKAIKEDVKKFLEESIPPTISRVKGLIEARVNDIKDKGFGDWVEFIKETYGKVKPEDGEDFDFLDTLDKLKDVLLDDIVQIEKFKTILREEIVSKFPTLSNDYTGERLKQIALSIAIEIASTVYRQLILPKLQSLLGKLAPFIDTVLEIAFDLQNIYKGLEDLKDIYVHIKALIKAKTLGEKVDAILALLDDSELALPTAVTAKIKPLLDITRAISDKVNINAQEKSIAIGVLNKGSGNNSIDIKLCARLKQADNNKAEIIIYPVVKGELGKKINVGENHQIGIGSEGELNGNIDKTLIGFLISQKNKKPQITLTGSEDNISAGVSLDFNRTSELSILDHEYLKISIGNYPQELYLGFKEGSFEGKYSASLKEAKLVLTKQFFQDKTWDFISEMFKDDIVASFDTTLSYSTKDGFSFAASPKIDFDIDFSKSFSKVKVDGVNIKAGFLGLGDAEKDTKLALSASTNIGLSFAGIGLAVNGIGLGLETTIIKDGKWGAWDFSPKIIFPSGIGLAVDTGAIKGGGFISYEENKFLGVLELSILEKIEINGFILLNTNVEGVTGGFSMASMLMISGMSIPLGFNFYLTGMGGSLGLNRMIDSKVVERGVHDGTLETVFLGKNLSKNISKIEKTITSYFPIKDKQFFFGAIAKIDFGIPVIVSGEMGLFIQLPKPFEIIVFGGLHVNIPEEKPLVAINVYFAGGINFAERFWFDASIRDSTIGGIDIFGDIAMRILWGSEKGMLISAGGFHPSFDVPAKYSMPKDMKRLGMKIEKDCFKLSMGAYFAVGTNTVQFGSFINLYADVKVAKIKGYFSFDALFIFSPFSFTVDIKAGVSISVFGYNLLAIDLEFGLSGTTPWRVKGKAYIKILFWKITAKFDVSWGDKAKEIAPETTPIYEKLLAEWDNDKNWRTISEADSEGYVKLAEIKDGELVLHPLDGFAFKQERVPLDQPMDTYGKKVPFDYNKISIDKIEVGAKELAEDKIEDEESLFIPADFIKMSEEEKLASPSFVDMKSGFVGKVDSDEKGQEKDVTVGYEGSFDVVKVTNYGFSIDMESEKKEGVEKQVNITDIMNAIDGEEELKNGVNALPAPIGTQGMMGELEYRMGADSEAQFQRTIKELQKARVKYQRDKETNKLDKVEKLERYFAEQRVKIDDKQRVVLREISKMKRTGVRLNNDELSNLLSEKLNVKGNRTDVLLEEMYVGNNKEKTIKDIFEVKYHLFDKKKNTILKTASYMEIMNAKRDKVRKENIKSSDLIIVAE